MQQGNLLNALDDLARKRGAWSEAEAHTRDALRLYQAAGTRSARVWGERNQLSQPDR